MTEKIEKFRNKLRITNQLINLSSEELLEEYKDKDDYNVFLETVNSIANLDNIFLLLDYKFIEKIQTVLLEQRFNIKDENCINKANQIIRYLNIIENVSYFDRVYIFDAYFAYHEYVRRVEFDTCEDLINTIGYDDIVLSKLEEGNVDGIEDVFFYSTTNYILYNAPEIYQNESIRRLTEEKLKKMSKRSGINNVLTNMNAKILLKSIKNTNNSNKNTN